MRWLPIVLIAIAALIARQVWLAPRAAPNTAAAATARARAELAPRIFAGGIVEGTQRELSLRFEIPGRIKAVHVRPGDVVKAGDLLVELESNLAELNLAEANVRLKMAVAERDQLIADAKRLARHLSRDVVPAAGSQVHEADTLSGPALQAPVNRSGSLPARQGDGRAASPFQNVAAQAESPQSHLSREEQVLTDGKIALAEAAVRRERLLLDQRRLVAPIDGVVLRATFQPGELTGPTDDGALLTLVNCDTIHVRAYVEELDALRVAPGQRVAVNAAGQPERPCAGVVRSCSPDVRPKSHRHLKAGERLDVRVREVLVELDGGGDLLMGLPVDVFIEPSPPLAPARPAERATSRR